MPTLYSITEDFLDELAKRESFSTALSPLKEQLPEEKVGRYISDAIGILQELLESDIELAELKTVIKELLEKRELILGLSARDNFQRFLRSCPPVHHTCVLD